MTAPQFKVTKRVTMPVLTIKPNAGDRFFKFVGAMHLGKKLDDQKAAATLLEAVDLVTGEHGVIIVPTILQNDLNENYPNNSYVGKSFCVTVTRNSAKKYNHVSLAEVEVTAEAPAEAPADAPAEAPAEALAEALAEAPAEAVADGESHASMMTPAEVAVAEAPSGRSRGKR